jgi:hypothetical protein
MVKCDKDQVERLQPKPRRIGIARCRRYSFNFDDTAFGIRVSRRIVRSDERN